VSPASREPGRGGGGVDAGDPDALLARAISGDDGHGAPGDLERSGEDLDELVVRGTLDGRGAQAHEHSVTARAGDGRTARARDHADGDLDAVGGGLNHRLITGGAQVPAA